MFREGVADCALLFVGLVSFVTGRREVSLLSGTPGRGQTPRRRSLLSGAANGRGRGCGYGDTANDLFHPPSSYSKYRGPECDVTPGDGATCRLYPAVHAHLPWPGALR